ncbi:MAG: phosphatidylserine/phosphatidylglycerophosphate/cardiolipin synthase family protein, partial [Lysobacterales bacterium]
MTPLRDGDEAYPQMLAAIAQAQHSISLLSYIFDSDRAGSAFFDALADAHRRGVEIRVLIDAVGIRYSKANMVRKFQAAGIQAAAFLPTRLSRLMGYVNLRNHRKILVTDGRIAFTGGTNIREDHWLKLDPSYPVSCLHFRFEGPVVAHLQEAFAIDWAFTRGESLRGEQWFPQLTRKGQTWCRGVAHGPDEDFEKITYTIMGALGIATRRIRIVTPYFIPHGGLIYALQLAAMKGIDVEILLPEKNNIRLVQWASQPLFRHLLDKGCRLYLSPPPFDHTKLLLVDDIWSLVGSTNWDARSLRLNFEFNVECYDEGLATELNAVVDEKIARSRPLSLADVNSIHLVRKIRNGLARVFSPYL